MRSFPVLLLVAALAVPAVTGESAVAAPVGKAPERVQVLSARTTSTSATLAWRAAKSGPRPTGYQVKVGAKRWKPTKRTRYRVKGLKPNRNYRISIRAVRRGKAGAPVVVRAFT